MSDIPANFTTPAMLPSSSSKHLLDIFYPPLVSLILSFSYFTNSRSFPIFSSLFFSNSKPNFLPNLNCKRQSSRDFLLIPTLAAASSRHNLQSVGCSLPSLGTNIPLYSFLQADTFSIISEVVRSFILFYLLRGSYYSSMAAKAFLLVFLCFLRTFCDESTISVANTASSYIFWSSFYFLRFEVRVGEWITLICEGSLGGRPTLRGTFGYGSSLSGTA